MRGCAPKFTAYCPNPCQLSLPCWMCVKAGDAYKEMQVVCAPVVVTAKALESRTDSLPSTKRASFALPFLQLNPKKKKQLPRCFPYMRGNLEWFAQFSRLSSFVCSLPLLPPPSSVFLFLCPSASFFPLQQDQNPTKQFWLLIGRPLSLLMTIALILQLRHVLENKHP